MHSEMLLKSAAVHQEEYQTEESQQMLILCTNIRECGEILLTIDNYDDQTPNSPQDPHAWQDNLAVLAVPDEQIFSQHHYAREARSITEVPRGRMRQLIKEINILQTDKLHNIFVRYGESRMDVMKIVIVGPANSPYENGLFEFDLLCPLNYPQEPPKMHLRTTGGGTVGFNPNLYHDGKVCLSLLGTWRSKNKEEEWQPGKSTVQQVLLSIQAMIFCDEPWCNEPGRESMQGTDQSKQYNSGLHKHVVKYGMLEWIEGKKTPEPLPKNVHFEGLHYKSQPAPVPYQAPQTTASIKEVDLFGEVAKKHFEVNRNDIINKVKEWIKEKKAFDSGMPNPPKKKKKMSEVQGEAFGGANRVGLLAANASLQEYLTAARQDLGGTAVGYGVW